MAGVWLIPARAWSIVVRREVGAPLRASVAGAIVGAVLFAAICLSAFIASDTLPRVFRCLWEASCTATRGGALFQLALFGISVLIVESLWFVSRLYWIRSSKRSP